MYTLEDLEQAVEELQKWGDRFDRCSGNHSNKYKSKVVAASRKVRRIERSLKTAGVLPLSDAELMENELDAAFPDASNQQIVEYKGRTFKRWFWPAGKTRSGTTIIEGDEGWEEIFPRD